MESGNAFKKKREDVFIATKYDVKTSSGDDLERAVYRSLSEIDTDYIDFYQFWGINLDKFENLIAVKNGPLERALRLKEQGVIRHISFSAHERSGRLSKIIEKGNGVFSSMLCQYNFLNRSLLPDMVFAKSQGLGVALMSPLVGGRLNQPLPSQDTEQKSGLQIEPALRFVFNNPYIDVVLSGMSTTDMLLQNVAIASNEQDMTKQEEKYINQVKQEFAYLKEIYCTGCNYCLPCPNQVNISHLMLMLQFYEVYGLKEVAKNRYRLLARTDKKDASACTQCGLCEERCPQTLSICKQLKKIHRIFTE